MDDNLPSDPEIRRKICALKGIPYTDPEPTVATPAVPGDLHSGGSLHAR